MSFTGGARLGPYEILSPLGAGGMGEVYRARDTRLSREVAIKVLPAELAEHPSRMKRFEKEARAASALNHPNIVTIYEIGSADSISYIAMERVEGSTLRELLVSGLPTRKLLQIATQMADGLAKAHEAGIVHRDLKPENVMVTKDGLVKILDFGLAKLTHSSTGSGEGSQLPTETRTSPGVVVGTASYMSPEQASGEEIDFRSDQFSFGSILYEMATGKRAFSRKTGVDTLAAILNEDPEPITTINPQTPAPLRWIVERCLAKEPEDRYASTKDLARDLASLRNHLSEASGATPSIDAAKRRSKWRAPLLIGLVLTTGIAIGLLASRRFDPEPPKYHRLTFRHGDIGGARFSADGQTIVYGAAWEGKAIQLFSTRPDATESTMLPLPSANILSISSSGAMAIGLQPEIPWSGGPPKSLAEVPLAGGAPREILKDVFFADFSPDGRNLAIVRRVQNQVRLECPIGHVLYESNGGPALPRFSPDGRSIAFLDSPPGQPGEIAIAVVDLAGHERLLTRGWQFIFGLAWNPTTEEVWFSAREAERGTGALSLHAVATSGRHRLVARSPESLIIQDISRGGRVLLSHAEFSQKAICLPPGSAKEADLSWHDLSEVIDLSDDGKRVLLGDYGHSGGAEGALYLRNTDGSSAVYLGEGLAAALSPDGNWAVAISSKLDRLTLVPTGPGQPRDLSHNGMRYERARFFPDGKRLLLSAAASDRPVRLWIQDIAGGAPRPVTSEGFDLGDSGLKPISPDGKWIVVRGPGGDLLLYPLEKGEPRPIRGSTPGDRVAGWDETGRALFVGTPSVPVRIEKLDLSTGHRELWKEIGLADPAGVGGIDVCLTPGGRSYAYWYLRTRAALFVADGLR